MLYKEFEDGVHLGLNNVILSIDLCLDIRESLRRSTSVGRRAHSLIARLSEIHGHIGVHVNEILDSYTNFELMVDRMYEYNCNLCGTYPTVLMTDVNRKAFFDRPIGISSHFCDGPRSMSEFWHKLGLACSLKSDVKSLVNLWSPWVSQDNVNGSGVISSESERATAKVTLKESVMITQEELLQSFNKLDGAQLIEFIEKDLGLTVDKKAAKTSMVEKILEALFSEDAFKKKFSTFFSNF